MILQYLKQLRLRQVEQEHAFDYPDLPSYLFHLAWVIQLGFSELFLKIGQHEVEIVVIGL